MKSFLQHFLSLFVCLVFITELNAQDNSILDNKDPKKKSKDEYYVNFTADPVCVGEPMVFKVQNADALDSVYWSFNDPNIENSYSNDTAPTFMFSCAGEFEVEMQYYMDHSGSAHKIKKLVKVIETPKANLPGDMSFCTGDSLEITTEYGDLFKYHWSNGSTEDHIVVKEEGLYNVVVSNECGSGQEWVMVKRSDCKCEYYLPNTFTPNGDGLNDVFRAEYYCDIEEFNIIIYDRWGEMLYQSDSPEFEWDGRNATFDGNAVYVYFINMKIRENHQPFSKKLKGTITLLP